MPFGPEYILSFQQKFRQRSILKYFIFCSFSGPLSILFILFLVFLFIFYFIFIFISFLFYFIFTFYFSYVIFCFFFLLRIVQKMSRVRNSQPRHQSWPNYRVSSFSPKTPKMCSITFNLHQNPLNQFFIFTNH